MTDRTTDELRDRLAELAGWKNSGERWYYLPEYDSENGTPYRDVHPFPAGDLTALAAAWPEGVYMTIRYTHWDNRPDARVWVASAGEGYSWVGDTEYDARLRLTVAVLEAKAAEAEA